jgi:hypothetical protein
MYVYSTGEARWRTILVVQKQQVLLIGLCVHVGTGARGRVHAHTRM